MVVSTRDILKQGHEAIVFGVNRRATNDTGFARMVCRHFGVAVSEINALASEGDLGDVFLIYPQKVNTVLVCLVVREHPGETRIEDVRTCFENLVSLGVLKGMNIGMVAVGCHPEQGSLLGGFRTLVKLAQGVGFQGTLYFPRRS